MKVLAGARLDLHPEGAAARVCARLAGRGGDVVSLAALELNNPYRPWSAAEVEALRGALRGETGLIGYVCSGVPVSGNEGAPGPARPRTEGAAGSPARLVAVTDHVNLTWRSPLTGPNDDRVGPRFPTMDRIYAPEAALPPGTHEDGMIVVRGVVAGVMDDRAPSEYETETVRRFAWVALSSELVPPVIIAAHLGLRVAAVVIV